MTSSRVRAGRGSEEGLILEACVECDRLWLEYVEALSEALKISEQWELARIQQDSNLCDMLELQWVQTFGRRLAARKTFKDHEAAHGQ